MSSLSTLRAVLSHGEAEKSTLRSWAKLYPLLAALIAPITSLLDIPALTQRWYARYGVPQPDFTASIVLSAVGLVFNLLANALLVLRFSATAKSWHLATVISLVCWFLKTLIAVTNLVVFGVFSRNSPGFTYEEGFWCAVVSVIGSGIISLLLLFHYIFQGKYSSDEESKRIRISGRHFMLSIISLTSLLALQSLIFCMVENWTYLDAIYFSVVTMLTIGFGDFVPTTTATRILLFPFVVLAIAQLANQVGMIIGFFSQRTEDRKRRWRRQYESLQDARALQNGHHNPDGDLKKEIDFLMAQANREQNLSEAYDLGWSLATLVTFWLVGAAIFSQLEHWPYGDGIYFCYVFFLTIGLFPRSVIVLRSNICFDFAGFGDFAPVSPAGRVIFVVYSLMAVPIVASFAVQTVTKILETLSERRLTQRKEAHVDPNSKNGGMYMSHAELCVQEHALLDEEAASIKSRSRSKSQSRPADSTAKCTVDYVDGDKTSGDSPDSLTSSADDPIQTVESPVDAIESSSRNSPTAEETDSAIADEEVLKAIDQLLVKRVLQLAVELETQARVLLLHTMQKGSRPEVLLRADMRLQHREVQKLHLEDTDTKLRPEGLVDLNGPERGALDIEDRVRRYRELFAALLAAGSKLQRLEGIEQLVWERRAKRERQIAEELAQKDPEARGRLKQKHVEENEQADPKCGAV
ncbi:hypothetical protein PILCRDRAFT_567574 [Piloderma croceum F 1598]|uniref:Potassium channel domain-containing protein n=1 Tax=Piloderma croceum (strain F 1598) TaxID=765440 RepID=A0A0C3BPA5_PILCF|nr:hypothetical protein PILCRDRAFT_567574 [Piloderma croceum F 1598]